MSLGMLGISFSDVIRLLAAVLLLGNAEFIQDGGQEPEIKSHRGKWLYTLCLLQSDVCEKPITRSRNLSYFIAPYKKIFFFLLFFL